MYRKKFFLFILAFVTISLFYFYKSPFFPKNFSDLGEIFSFLKEEVGEKTEIITPINQNTSFNKESFYKETIPQNQNINQSSQNTNSNENEKIILKEIIIPKQINHYLPFTSQAPLGEWDSLHEEACEEASLLMAHYFIKGDKLILSREAEDDLQKLIYFTKEVYPKKEDININELKEVAKQYYKYDNFEIITNPTIFKIEEVLSNNSIIIAPMAGRILNNPYFKNPGPLYHMLIISGFDKEKNIFITQDPGTKRGKDFTYSVDTLMDALHDFPGKKEQINKGEKKILVIPKS